MTTFTKVWFSSTNYGETGGVVFETAKLKGMSVPSISRFFPTTECMKMERIHTTGPFASVEEALLAPKALPHSAT